MDNTMFGGFPSRRTSVLSCNGAVATNNPIASGIGLEILKAGGNAADASVAVAAALNVMDPGNTGLGGDCFVMFYDANTKTVKGINGSGRSSSKLSLELLNKNGISKENGYNNIPFESPFSITVPGAAAGWCDTVKQFGSGKLSMHEILEPAIKAAEEGYATHELTAHLQGKYFVTLKRTDNSSGDDFFINGKPPGYGDVMTNPKLANVFRKLAAGGKEEFYGGDIAKSIINTVTAAGGCLSLEDMKSHASTFDEPISTDYREIRVWEMPPNGQGLIALMGLNILEGFDLKSEERVSASCLHKMIEATQLAFADGMKYIADPSKVHVPIERLLSKEYAKARCNLISDEHVNQGNYKPSEIEAGSDTVYFTVVDLEGNACSFINSIYCHGGSGFVPLDCGFVMHCRGSNFSLEEGHANCVGPNKRPYHTIMPGMATHASNNELYASFGNMGGFMQPQGHIQVLSNLIDFKLDPQTAICMPRFCVDVNSKEYVVGIEDSVLTDVQEKLLAMGHNVKIVRGPERTVFGGAQIIQVGYDSRGRKVLWSGSESRQDGCALGY